MIKAVLLMEKSALSGFFILIQKLILAILLDYVQPIRHTTLILYLLSFSATREGEEDMDREAG